MVHIAVTGGIACGKTLVGEFLSDRGVRVCDVDHIAHTLLRAGDPVFGEVVASFGRGILAPDGAIDRRALGVIVFADAAARERLNALVHPAVTVRLAAWRRRMSDERVRVCAALVPLLFEAELDTGWDAVVCVVASPAAQQMRLCERGFTVAEARCRMQAQLPQKEKARRSDYVVINDGTKALAEEQTSRALKSILERSYGREHDK